MNYASIRKMDISNGEGLGIALFVQGCPIHCKGCFNSSTWDPKGGKPFKSGDMLDLLCFAGKLGIKRFSILGGEPLAEYNVEKIAEIIKCFRRYYGNEIKIWLYTGYTYESIMKKRLFSRDKEINKLRRSVIKNVDILVDGQYMEQLKDMNLKYRGSSNQRIIDVKKSTSRKVIKYIN